MTDMFHLTVDLLAPEQTAELAVQLGASLVPGDTVLLDGPVGAGKSLFCRALIQSRLAALGRTEDVPSPSFTLVQTYDLGGAEIWHADLYRLSDPQEIVELGLEEAFDTAICLVEWAGRLGDMAPPDALHVTILPGAVPEARQIMLTGPQDWQDRLTLPCAIA
ncbi:MAG: tRNA (adenosine(37)-N6)-threonylcarbamoyltransferase complex ATPase subunit type 1 TsaE [Natronohydrobacter sp.]|nr:tRNA (adenosine(37)-N6)-threonylcarbamoyltransferase complex ATPase subunit type 1 TsaE [Natronohydrobacter sp.]